MFVIEPFDFEHEYSQALLKRLHGRIEVRFVSVGMRVVAAKARHPCQAAEPSP
jgi:hypothetical protein